MTRMRIVGLALVAVFAMSAVAVASASAALPELVNPSTGNALKKKGDTSTSGVGKLVTVGGSEVVCKKDKDVSKLSGTKADTVTTTFEECSAFGFPCTSAGQASGVIKTEELASKLVYIDKATKEVGVALEPAAKGGLIAKFECAGVVIEVKGSVIGKITPVNTPVKPPAKFTLTFSQAGGKQIPEFYESGTKKVKDTLETKVGAGAFEQSAEETTAEELLEEEAEVRA